MTLRSHRTVVPWLALPLVALALAACTDTSTPTVEPAPPAPAANLEVSEVDADAPVMRTYEVPAGRSDELEQVLKSAMSMGRDQPPRGRVDQLHDGRLVVVAPESIHAGVAQLCLDFQGQPEPPPPTTIPIDYWVVRAQRGETADAGALPAELEGVAQEILVDGPAKLTLVEHLRLASSAHDFAKVEGRYAKVQHRFSPRGDRLVANIDFETRRSDSQVESTLSIEPETFVILGVGGDGDDSVEDASLYYVLRAQAPNL